MDRSTRILVWVFGLVIAAIAMLLLLPSLLGSLLVALLVFAFIDLFARRYRSGVRTLNSSLRAVCDHDGAIEKVAVAFSRTGPLRESCYEFARRLLAGEEAVSAAMASRIPLQLSTAIALTAAQPPGQKRPGQEMPRQETPGQAMPGREALDEPNWIESSSSNVTRELALLESTTMPIYGQFLYLTVTATVTCLVLAFMSTFIMPTIDQMFEEFGMSVPLARVFDVAPLVWVLVVVGLLLMAGVLFLNRIRWVGVRLPRWVPMTPKMAERQADMLTGLADGIDAGWPVGRAMALGHVIARSGLERRSLESAMRLIQQGTDPLEAVHRIGWLDSSQLAWLSQAPPQRAAQLLRHFAAQTVREARENTRWIMAFLFPAVVLGLGIVVLLYAVAFFGALAGLTNGLS